jgi:YD repeat-containing protein
MKMVKGSEFRQVWNFLYDSDGQLESASIIGSSQWRYDYDSLGNLKTSGRLSFNFDDFGRLRSQNGLRSTVQYDENGNVISNLRSQLMTYTASGQLASITSGSQIVNYEYDHLNRLISKKTQNGLNNLTQYFYADLDRPHRLSHVYRPRTGGLTSLVYGMDDRLIFMANDQHEFYVVTDRNGSPLLFLTPTGSIVREVTRTPYGEVTFDSNRQFEDVLGFSGAIYDPDVNLLHFQVRFFFYYFEELYLATFLSVNCTEKMQISSDTRTIVK